MGIIAFALIFGPWAALVVLVWTSRDRFADARLDLFQRRTAKPAETKTHSPPSAVEPIAETRPIAGPSPIAGDATLTGA